LAVRNERRINALRLTRNARPYNYLRDEATPTRKNRLTAAVGVWYSDSGRTQPPRGGLLLTGKR